MSEPDRLVSILDLDREFAPGAPADAGHAIELLRPAGVLTWMLRDASEIDVRTVPARRREPVEALPPRPRSGAREAARRRRQMEKARR